MIKSQPPHSHKPDILLMLVCLVGIAFLLTLSFHASVLSEQEMQPVSPILISQVQPEISFLR